MIVEGSCGSKDCNDAENLVLTSQEWIIFLNEIELKKIENCYFK